MAAQENSPIYKNRSALAPAAQILRDAGYDVEISDIEGRGVRLQLSYSASPFSDKPIPVHFNAAGSFPRPGNWQGYGSMARNLLDGDYILVYNERHNRLTMWQFTTEELDGVEVCDFDGPIDYHPGI